MKGKLQNGTFSINFLSYNISFFSSGKFKKTKLDSEDKENTLVETPPANQFHDYATKEPEISAEEKLNLLMNIFVNWKKKLVFWRHISLALQVLKHVQSK